MPYGEQSGGNNRGPSFAKYRAILATISAMAIGGGTGYFIRWQQERPDKTCTYDIPDVAWKSPGSGVTIKQGSRDASVTLFRKDDPERNDAITYHSDSRSPDGGRILAIGAGATHIRLTDPDLDDGVNTIVTVDYYTETNGAVRHYTTDVKCGKDNQPPEPL